MYRVLVTYHSNILVCGEQQSLEFMMNGHIYGVHTNIILDHGGRMTWSKNDFHPLCFGY